MDALPDRRGLHTKDLRHLFGRQLLQVAQHERVPVQFRKLRQGVPCGSGQTLAIDPAQPITLDATFDKTANTLYAVTVIVLGLDTSEASPRVTKTHVIDAFTATPAVLAGPVEGEIYIEQPKWIAKTNTHFTVTVDDETYRKMRAEADFWGHRPGRFYDLDHNNCISFVGKIAQMAGLKVNYPKNLMRKPRAWLNHISALNPQLHAKAIGG